MMFNTKTITTLFLVFTSQLLCANALPMAQIENTTTTAAAIPETSPVEGITKPDEDVGIEVIDLKMFIEGKQGSWKDAWKMDPVGEFKTWCEERGGFVRDGLCWNTKTKPQR